MKIGQTIKLKSTNAIIKVTHVNDHGQAVKGQEIDTGEVIDLLNQSYTIMTIVGKLFKWIKDYIKAW